jgi:glycolate oxidase iron-sulfur subunit
VLHAYKVTPEQILEQVDSCVKCGLCLPHCPTYRQSRMEADSPRGRVALAQGLASGALLEGNRLAEHLDRCLGCRACEAACPSGVPVTGIVDGVRALRMGRQAAVRRALRRGLLRQAVRPAAALALLRLYQRSGLRHWLRRSGLLHRAGLARVEGLLPERLLDAPPDGRFTAVGPQGGEAILFPGCVGRYLDAPVLATAATLLTRLGYGVVLPHQSICCGALYRHDGFAAEGDAELARCTELLGGPDGPPVLTVASACLGELRRSAALAGRVQDISRFLADLPCLDDLPLIDTPMMPWVHVPCTQRYLLQDPDAALDLLRRLPGVSPMALPGNEVCCGAAGTYLLRQPQMSRALLEEKLRGIADMGVSTLVTTNSGCALQLAVGVHERGLGVAVSHPVEVVAARMGERLETERADRDN